MVDTLSVGLKDAYDMYKELRDQGLIWKDCDPDNIGRLIKDNQIYFEGIDHIDKNATGYIDCNNEILKKAMWSLLITIIFIPKKNFKLYLIMVNH